MSEQVQAQPKGKPDVKNFFKKVWNSLKAYFSKSYNIILVIFFIILAIGVILPLISMIGDSLTVHTKEEALYINEMWNKNLKKGDFTFMQWPTLLFQTELDVGMTQSYSATAFWLPLGRSLLMALVACLIAVVGGGVLAFLISRTNMPCKKFISTVFIFPYIMPSWSLAMFWQNFFKNTGLSTIPSVGLLQSITRIPSIGFNGICVPLWMVDGFFPTAIVMGIHYAPFAYILIGGILRNMDANLEEAATILKASRAKIVWRITLPIVAPAMVSTILLVFASSLSSYTVPAFLCNVNPSYFLSLTMRSALTAGKMGEGYVMATVLLLFSMAILIINNAFTRSRKRFTTVSGKSGQISKINLGKVGKWIISILIIILVVFFAIVPLLSFVIESLEETPGDIKTATLKYWFSKENTIDDIFLESRDLSTKGIFFNGTVMASFGRSILIALIVAMICGTCGILVGYAVSKKRHSRFANLVSSLAFLPYLIPSLSFGAIFLSVIKTDSMQFLDVSTTMKEASAVAICIIVGAIKFLPFASRSGTNAMLQLSGEIEEAAIITGCSWGKRMTRILFPIQKSSFISGYLLPFISCMREYTLFVLITSSFTLATNVMEYFTRNGASQLANGINLLIVVFVIATNLIVNKVTGASIDKGIGG